MAIYRLLKNSTLEPEEISRITEAYEQALHTLCVKDRDDPLTEMIAKQVIKIAQAGVHDAAQLSALAVAELRIRYGRLHWRRAPRPHPRGGTNGRPTSPQQFPTS